LCFGLNNTCTNEIKDFTLKLCTGCKNGTNRTVHNRYAVGDEYEANGRTYKKTNSQPKTICSTEGCNNFREIADKCIGCTNGTRRTSNKDLKKGDFIELNNILYVYNGTQKVQVCTHMFEDNTRCKQPVTKDSKCKKHSEHWRCKFTGARCDNIRVKRTDYCHGHKNNNINPRKHSYGEDIIAEYLDSQYIKYKTNKYMKTRTGYCYIDIYIPELNVAIEYDGEQHFVQNEYWGGEKGLIKRQNADMEKDNHCFKNNIKILRIASYDAKNKDDIIKYVDMFLNMQKHPADLLYGTHYYSTISRPYITI
jgi:very-short-patch-repair endonuclease